eukprot:1976300-Rhodomonas_salina.1
MQGGRTRGGWLAHSRAVPVSASSACRATGPTTCRILILFGWLAVFLFRWVGWLVARWVARCGFRVSGIGATYSTFRIEPGKRPSEGAEIDWRLSVQTQGRGDGGDRRHGRKVLAARALRCAGLHTGVWESREGASVWPLRQRRPTEP